MDEYKLGDFEGVVLKSVHFLGDNAYGVPIRQEAEKILGRIVAIGAVYTTLERLVTKGYVKSWEGEPDAVRGGRRKRYYAIQGLGLRALENKALDVQKVAAIWAGTSLNGETT